MGVHIDYNWNLGVYYTIEELGKKYLSPRLGSKSETPIELDLMKAENYIHRARTGKWLDKEFLDPFGG